MKDVFEELLEQEDKSIIDTIFLIASGFFEDYEEYRQWWLKTQEALKNSYLGPIKADYKIMFQGKPIIMLFKKDIFDYIRKNYGRREY